MFVAICEVGRKEEGRVNPPTNVFNPRVLPFVHHLNYIELTIHTFTTVYYPHMTLEKKVKYEKNACRNSHIYF